LSWLLAIPYVLLAGHAILRQFNINSKKEIKIPANLSNGITFFDEFIIIKKKDGLKVFSSWCTHLGCRINSTENGNLICPCHGSEFDLEGKNIKGPANKPLTGLKYSFDSSSNEIIINV